MIAVKNDDGGYTYFVNVQGLSVNGKNLEDIPVVSREVSKMTLEIMEAKNG